MCALSTALDSTLFQLPARSHLLDLTASVRDDVGVAGGQMDRWTGRQVGRWTGQLVDGFVLCFCCFKRMILSDFSLTFYVADVKFILIVSFGMQLAASFVNQRKLAALHS